MLLAILTAFAVAAAPLGHQSQFGGQSHDHGTAAPALDLATVLRRAGPAPERLAAEAELAAAAYELSLSRGLLLQGPALSVATGPRRAPAGDDSDLALEVDLPLAADRAERRAALLAVQEARPVLLAAADLEAMLALELAYVDAWQAAEAFTLAEREVEAAERGLAAVAARVAAGAEAPYETSLVAAEAAVAQLQLAATREQVQVAWAQLRGRADVGNLPVALAEPAIELPMEPPPSGSAGSLANAVLARGVTSRGALARSLAALEAARAGSRWSLGAELAREGEEDVARLGFGYRIPLSGQSDTRSAARDALLAASTRNAELDLSRLAGRLAGARARAQSLAAGTPLRPNEVERALAALDARLAAGRDRPSQALPLRRQLVGALSTALTARAARLRAAFEIEALTTESSR